MRSKFLVALLFLDVVVARAGTIENFIRLNSENPNLLGSVFSGGGSHYGEFSVDRGRTSSNGRPARFDLTLFDLFTAGSDDAEFRSTDSLQRPSLVSSVLEPPGSFHSGLASEADEDAPGLRAANTTSSAPVLDPPLVVPEPSYGLLWAAGLGAFVAVTKRRARGSR